VNSIAAVRLVDLGCKTDERDRLASEQRRHFFIAAPAFVASHRGSAGERGSTGKESTLRRIFRAFNAQPPDIWTL
jgi:hypothetical protein